MGKASKQASNKLDNATIVLQPDYKALCPIRNGSKRFGVELTSMKENGKLFSSLTNL